MSYKPVSTCSPKPWSGAGPAPRRIALLFGRRGVAAGKEVQDLICAIGARQSQLSEDSAERIEGQAWLLLRLAVWGAAFAVVLPRVVIFSAQDAVHGGESPPCAFLVNSQTSDERLIEVIREAVKTTV